MNRLFLCSDKEPLNRLFGRHVHTEKHEHIRLFHIVPEVFSMRVRMSFFRFENFQKNAQKTFDKQD